ncbi:D-glycero-beta-D-manno-heptose 1,7-bisphosphate 7-phosphatase [uncultured Salinisphaera sp.]|uniref:D-glycero-beta-D-manno-heptose 1,7-bisphosphate 7-phosphatase n=1 Tax=uncultured Salinisphaera sp. TaxID=359372 RepID=UPI0032B28E81|tara:strand:+ start:1380 stop:1940 length:561 start_codon:yes stop_codon:yes gene_type:complete
MKLIILDRDGVINEDSDDYIKSPAEWRPLPGSLEAILKLKNAGYRVVVASNQSGLARGLFDYDTLFAIHDKMTRMLADIGTHVDGIFFCPHGPDDGCRCRKPDTGLLDDIAKRFGRALAGTPFIGDSLSDIRAAQAAGATPVLVRSGKAVAEDAVELAGVDVYDDLAEAAGSLIARDKSRTHKKGG